jgi:putative ABC transport system substrate-binding protein
MRRREFIAGLAAAITAFLQGLKETGYVAGQTVAIEYRYAENQVDRLPALAAELVGRRVAVIVAAGGPAAQIAKRVTTSIPIAFNASGDPVALGLVASLNRPGANATGSAILEAELAPKRLQLLPELILPDEAPPRKNKCRAASLRADRRARLGSWEVTVDTGILSLLGRL